MVGLFDVAVFGAGIAGMGISSFLSSKVDKVLLLERSRGQYEHSTARSVALLSESYAPTIQVSKLISASTPLLRNPPSFMGDRKLVSPRPTVYVWSSRNEAMGDNLFEEMRAFPAKTQLIKMNELFGRVPILNPEYASSGILESDSGDLDVDALYQGFRRHFNRNGGTMRSDAELMAARFKSGTWNLETRAGRFEAKILVNAAGAWGDIVAQRCEIEAMGLIPLARTALQAEPVEALDSSNNNLPFVFAPFDDLYFRYQSGRFILSPADERPTVPCDEQPLDEDIARTMANFEMITTVVLKPSRPRSWAGIRTFSPDRNPIVGFDSSGRNFFWLVGQGGFGIETAPALSDLAASLVTGDGIPECLQTSAFDREAISPLRFAKVR